MQNFHLMQFRYALFLNGISSERPKVHNVYNLIVVQMCLYQKENNGKKINKYNLGKLLDYLTKYFTYIAKYRYELLLPPRKANKL